MGHYILIHVHIAFVSEGRENGKGRNKEGRKEGRRREGGREGGREEGGREEERRMRAREVERKGGNIITQVYNLQSTITLSKGQTPSM